MKKIIRTLILAVACTLLVACAKTNKNNKINIVTSIYPIYDWTLNVVGNNGNINITLLQDSGADLHNYQPTVADIAKVSSSDLFIYVGGESDEWVEDALKSAVNKDMITINLLETLGDKAKEEELIEGMEGEEEGEDHEHEEGEEEKAEYDEHVWLSLNNAQIFVSKIKDALVSIDKANAKTYEANAKKYNDELKALDAKYADAVSKATIKTLLFGDRFPFRYLVDDYDLKYFAAFIGCSSETEASFETIVFLSNKVNELGLKAIMKIESSDGSIANTIKNNTTSKNQKILTLNSLQSSTLADHKKGNTYLKIMTDNLEVLKEALS